MYPTVADALALPVIRQGKPRVVAAHGALDRRVRWVHVAEVADIAHLLRGDELVLTTGIALPDEADGLARYVDELADVGVAGIVVELLRINPRIYLRYKLRSHDSCLLSCVLWLWLILTGTFISPASFST